ncbi:hypothetical protein DY000_02053895 [Brassica cretica]|uniref:Uncharacterized protein n=1 Tax=Brassica cretica TaxID=69181 RepID=A0ABQ7AMJ5_BRACR|nr:hypothetical protein DY000_02053895 [Brassica cretica]
MIILRERILQASDKLIPDSKTTIVQLAEGASWTKCTVQLAERASWIDQVVQLTVRQVGSTSLPSSRPRSSLLRDWIEPSLVSSRSESPLELYDLKP